MSRHLVEKVGLKGFDLAIDGREGILPEGGWAVPGVNGPYPGGDSVTPYVLSLETDGLARYI